MTSSYANPGACWEYSGSKQKAGYGELYIGDRKVSAHRISYYLFNGVTPGDLLVCHKCDNPKCFNPSHLFLGTVRDNALDMMRKGRGKNGSHYGKCKFSDEDVLRIRADHAAGMGPKALRAKYKMSQPYIYQITRYINRSHLVPHGVAVLPNNRGGVYRLNPQPRKAVV